MHHSKFGGQCLSCVIGFGGDANQRSDYFRVPPKADVRRSRLAPQEGQAWSAACTPSRVSARDPFLEPRISVLVQALTETRIPMQEDSNVCAVFAHRGWLASGLAEPELLRAGSRWGSHRVGDRRLTREWLGEGRSLDILWCLYSQNARNFEIWSPLVIEVPIGDELLDFLFNVASR